MLDLEGIAPTALPQQVSFTFRPTQGSDLAVYSSAFIGPDGIFALTGIPSGSYELHVESSKYLSNNLPVDATRGNVSDITTLLLAGDSNDDDSIDVLDLDLFIQAFDSVEGDANWNDGTADVNYNGSVDVLDLDILIRNFDRMGDV